MNTPIVYEAPRFGRTGPGCVYGMRWEFISQAIEYSLDAPDFIAQGGTSGYLQNAGSNGEQHYITFTTGRREW